MYIIRQTAVLLAALALLSGCAAPTENQLPSVSGSSQSSVEIPQSQENTDRRPWDFGNHAAYTG